MPNNLEAYKLKSMSKADLKAHRTMLNDLINEVNGIYVMGPNMEKYNEGKENLVKAKEDLDDVISLKDTTSVEGVKFLKEYHSSLESALSKIKEVDGRTQEGVIFKKPVSRVNQKLKAAYNSIGKVIKDKMKPYSEKSKKITDKCFGLFKERNIQSEENRIMLTKGQPFDQIGPAGYIMSRSAVQNAMVGYLLYKGYTPEQIYDTTQINEEKQEAFREIAGHMNGGTEEDQKWLGEVFVKGVDKIIENINEIGNDITPEEADLNNRKFVDLILLGHSWFDLTQEMDKCKDGCKSYVRDVKKQDPEKYWDEINNKGILSSLPQLYLAECESAENIMDPTVTPNLIPSQMIKTKIIINHRIKNFFKLREENPDVPVCKLGSDAEYMISSTFNENALGNAVMSQFNFNSFTLDQKYGVVDHLINSDALKEADYSGDVNAGQPLVIHGVPSQNDMFVAGAAYGENRDQMIASLVRSADNAQIGVNFGSSEYNDAVKALKALDSQLKDFGAKLRSEEITENAQKVPVYKKMREQARIAEEKINKYFEHKREQGLLDGGASPKTQKRINVMKKALAEIRESREAFEDRLVNMHTDRARTALRQKYNAERSVDNIVLNGRNKKLTADEKKQIGIAMAAATVCEDEFSRLRKDKTAEPRSGQELLTRSQSRLNSKPFNDTIKMIDRNSAKQYVSGKGYFKEHYQANVMAHKKQAAKAAKTSKTAKKKSI